MQKTLIELESKIHSLQCATKDERDKFIFQICRQLIQDKIDNQNKDERIIDTNKTIISQTEISDEELEKLAELQYPYNQLTSTELKGLIVSAERAAWIDGIKWYREQLKKK